MKNTMQKIASLVLTGALIISCLPPVTSATSFSDVDITNLGTEVFEAIMFVADNGIMSGTGPSQFSPNMVMPRAQIVQLLFNMEGQPTHSKDGTLLSDVSIPFVDVPANAWYYNAVRWAYKEGVVNGTSSTTFSPEMTVNTEQTVTILYRYETNICDRIFSVSSLINTHGDYANISSYARTPMNWALTYAIIQPVSATTYLYPQLNMLRKTMALYICRLEKNAVGFQDNNKRLGFTNYTSTRELSQNAYNVLTSIIYSRYSSNEAQDIINDLSQKMTDSGGNCSGISFANYFDAIGRIDFNWATAGNAYPTMNSITSKSIGNVRYGISLYQLLMNVAADFRTDFSNPTEAALTQIKTNIEKHGPVLFNYFWKNANNDTVGHALIVTKIVKVNSSQYKLTTIDPNNIDNVSVKTFSLTSSGMYYGSLQLTTIGYFSATDVNEIAFLDIDGRYNNHSLSGTTRATAQGTFFVGKDYPAQRDNDAGNSSEVETSSESNFDNKMIVTVPAQDFTLKTDSGKTLSYCDNELSGSISVLSNKLIENGDEVAFLRLILGIDETLEFISNSKDTDITVTSNTINSRVSTKGAGSIRISANETVVTGDNAEYAVLTSTGLSHNRFVCISGTIQNTLTIQNVDNTLSVANSAGKNEISFFGSYMQQSNPVVFYPTASYSVLGYDSEDSSFAVEFANGQDIQAELVYSKSP